MTARHRPTTTQKQLLLGWDGDLVWVTEINDKEVRYEKTPLSTFWQRLMSGFIGILPVES